MEVELEVSDVKSTIGPSAGIHTNESESGHGVGVAGLLEQQASSYRQAMLKKQAREACIVLCNVFSPSGDYLISGNQSGSIAVWRVNAALAVSVHGYLSTKPCIQFDAHSNQSAVYTLCFVSDDVLVSGGDDCIHMWDWKQVLAALQQTDDSNGTMQSHTVLKMKPISQLLYPIDRNDRSTSVEICPETNDMFYQRATNTLVSCAGDGKCYSWDVEKRSIVSAFPGHVDGVYAVASLGPNKFASGGEDGVVRIWDSKTAKCTNTLNCIQGTATDPDALDWKQSLPWIGCMSASEDGSWLACGGGARYVATWHLPSLSVTATMPTAGTPQAVKFHNGKILSAGNENRLYKWSMEGKRESVARVSAPSVLSIATSDQGVVACSGISDAVDVFVDPSIVSATLTFR
jgi:WD40 repeat protein